MNVNNTTIRIGDKKLAHSTNFLSKNDEIVSLDLPVENQRLRLSIVFKEPNGAEKADGRWLEEDGVVKFTFTGWNNPLGTAILEPTKFGDIGEDKKIYFQLTHHYVGELNLVNLYIFIGQ